MRLFPLLFALGFAGAAACSRSTSALPTEILPGQSLQLRLGESAQVKGTSVLVRVAGVNDSRCPSDVACIQAGDAAVALEFSSVGGGRTDTLYYVRQPHGATYGAYRFDLADVQPYPVSTRRNVPQVVTLRLGRAE